MSTEEKEKIQELRNSRGGYKGQITKLVGEIRALVTATVDNKLQPVQEHLDHKLDSIKKMVDSLEQNQKELSGMFTDEQDLKDINDYMVPIYKDVETIKQDVASLLLSGKVKMIAQVKEPVEQLGDAFKALDIDVKPEDSVSQVISHTSRASKTSSVASSRAKAAAKAAALVATADRLQEKQRMECEELALKQKKAALELETKLAAAKAEQEVYDALDGDNVSSRFIGERCPGTKSFEKTSVHVTPKKLPLNPAAPEWPLQTSPLYSREGLKPDLMDVMYSGQRQQQRILDAMTLPRVELTPFDGDPLKYWLFIRQFENSVGLNDIDNGQKLLLLMQYCSGRAKQVIQCCLAMEPTQGYAKARHLLKERFGNEFTISETWVNKLTDGRAIGAHDKIGILDLADDLRNCVENLDAMGYIGEISSQRVLLKIVERLPSFLKNRWVHDVHGIRKRASRNPDVADLLTFIEDAASECNDPVYGKLNEKKETNRAGDERQRPGHGRGANFSVTIGANDQNQHPATPSTPPCIICDQSHTLFGCTKFKEMSVEGRRNFAEDKKLCFNCLKPGHNASKCNLTRTCSVAGCGKKHTKFLHPLTTQEESVTQSKETQQQANRPTNAQAMCNATGAGIVSKIALPIVPVKARKSPEDEPIVVYALLDNGSTSTFITEELASRLKLEGELDTLTLTTLEREKSMMKTSVVDLQIAPMESNTFTPLENVYTKATIPISEAHIGSPEEVRKWPHLQDIEIPMVESKSVMMLIGQDNPELLLPHELRKGSAGQPYATRTTLGWTINGPLGIVHTESRKHATAHFVGVERSLEDQVKKFWNLEDYESLVSNKNGMSVEDHQAIEIWEQSIERDNRGHYSLDIPFRKQPPGLVYNRQLAEKRLQGLKKKLLRDQDLHMNYCKEMQSLIDKGYAERVQDCTAPQGQTWFLPHHAVFNEKKPGKLRIVFDCAAKYGDSCLNDSVMQGPDLTNSLLGVLLRFRQGPIAVMSDIEAMFHQVVVTSSQRDALRFLWWPSGDVNNEPVEFRMTVHLFGGTWSPSCCNFALRRTAEDNKDQFKPDVTQRVYRDFYVDDCLSSLEDEETAVMVVNDLSKLLEKGGFRLTKWASNSHSVLATIPEDERAKEVKGLDLDCEALPGERVLGVNWNMEEDMFVFKVKIPDKPITRRGLLSAVSSVYDPMGLLAPVTLNGKRIIQDLTRDGLGWDEVLPDEYVARWKNWLDDLPQLSDFKMPRCFRERETTKPIRHELHHFSDASETAYGTVSYLLTYMGDGKIQSSMILAKSRLAPLKTMTIPRLELTAAAMAVKIDGMLREELDIKIDQSSFWTDSTIVLGYITNTTKRFQTYVANRLTVIHNGSQKDQWRYVPSEQNPADDISRGLTASELVNSGRWLTGPSFLQNKTQWPNNPTLGGVRESDLEIKHNKPLNVFTNSVNVDETPVDRLIKHYSSWYRLKRGVAWLLRAKEWLYLKACKGNSKPQTQMKQPLNASDLQHAEQAIIRHVQERHYGQQLKKSMKETPFDGKKVSKGGPLYGLRPVINENGLLCVGGRLGNATFSETQRHPVILPKQHHIVTLIIRECHETSAHVGREHVLSLVRQSYWIVSGRNAVKRVLKDCFICKRYFGRTATQRMADLPRCRVEGDSPPFTYTGVDFFGPVIVKRGRSEVKRYGCLFTCLTIRAVHLEISYSLDTDSFVNALHRFVSRRGKPREIWCDNGTNFVGAEKQLKHSLEEWNQEQIHDNLLQKGIQWHFNPPKASHMGGVWERMIRTTRKILTPLLKDQTVDDEGLTTLFCMVESIINGRPLTVNSDDPGDLVALTPNDLLLPGTPMLPQGIFEERDLYCRRRWRQIQYLANVFWRRWMKEYLPTLQVRSKWLESKRNLTEGDIVLLVEETARSSWPLARVLETYPGEDGHVRSAKVKTQFTTLVRPVTKMCLLEAHVEQ